MTLFPPDMLPGDRILYTPGGRQDVVVIAPPERDGLMWRVPCRDGVTLHLASAARCEVRR